MNRILLLTGAAVLLALAAPAFAGESTPQPPAETTMNIQGDQASWIADPHVHAFYDLSVETFGHGAGPADEAVYTQKAFAIFRDFGAARGVPPEQMVDHLKLIPGQVAKGAREDPSILKSYAAFTVFLFGPQ